MLQWLFRSEPIDDAIRLERLEQTRAEIEHTFEKLIREGLVGAVGTFPYSVAFGRKVSEEIKSNTGWITYFNLLEQENIKHIPKNQWLVGLRPLAAGRIFSLIESMPVNIFEELIAVDGLSSKDSILHLALSYCLMHDVPTNVLSINTMEQAKSLQRVMQHIRPIADDTIKYVQSMATMKQ